MMLTVFLDAVKPGFMPHRLGRRKVRILTKEDVIRAAVEVAAFSVFEDNLCSGILMAGKSTNANADTDACLVLAQDGDAIAYLSTVSAALSPSGAANLILHSLGDVFKKRASFNSKLRGFAWAEIHYRRWMSMGPPSVRLEEIPSDLMAFLAGGVDALPILADWLDEQGHPATPYVRQAATPANALAAIALAEHGLAPGKNPIIAY